MMKIKTTQDLDEFYKILAYEETRDVEDVMLDALRHYRRVIQGRAAKELSEHEGVDLITEFFREEGIDIE